MMKKPVAIVTAFLCLVAVDLLAQRPSSLSWRLHLQGNTDRPLSPDLTMLDTQTELTLWTSLANDDGPPIVGLYSAVSNLKITVTRQVAGTSPVPVKVVTRVADPPSGATLQPRESMRLDFTLNEAGGKGFPPGTYTITADLSGVLSALTVPGGARWTGRAKPSDAVTLTIKDLSRIEDKLALLDAKGNHEFGKGNYRDAIPHLEQLATLAPERWHPHFVLGSAYLHVGEPQKAIAQWELALPLALKLASEGDEKTYVSTALARVYLTLNRQDDAAKALRTAGLRDDEVAARLRELRQK